MKIVILTIALLLSNFGFAAGSADGVNPPQLDAFTKMSIITALLKTPEAQNEYDGEASIADLMKQDVSQWLSNELGDGRHIILNCRMQAESEATMYCNLTSYDGSGMFESGLVIEATVHLPAVSTEIQVYDVQAYIAG